MERSYCRLFYAQVLLLLFMLSFNTATFGRYALRVLRRQCNAPLCVAGAVLHPDVSELCVQGEGSRGR